MLASRWISGAALLGAAGVALGAFGAHGLGDVLAQQGLDAATAAKRFEWFETAVRYHLWHVPALLAVGFLADRGAMRHNGWVGGLFSFGIAIFSGLLYVMALTGMRWLGAIVPLGGLALIAGWIALAWQARQLGVNR